MNDKKAAKPFTTMLRFQCPTFVDRWCFTMPEPAMKNPVKTPMA